MNPEIALYQFFLARLSPDELRRWLGTLPNGRALLGELPGGNVGAAQLHADAADLLNRHGLLRVAEFWDSLAALRPHCGAEVDALKAKFMPDAGPTKAADAGSAPATPPPAATAPPTTAPPATQPQRLKILLVSASPGDQDRLRVDREFRDIVAQLRGARYRDRVQVEQLPAATLAALRTALLEHEPHVLHISCHGTTTGDLIFESKQDGSQRIARRNMLGLLTALRDNLRLVFLNGCETHHLAREIPPNIDLAIGMTEPIVDDAAIDLSVAFYEALAFGKPVATAFAAAVSGLDGLDAANTPQLFPPADADPDGKRKQRLIQP